MVNRSGGTLFGARVGTVTDGGVYYLRLEDGPVARALLRRLCPFPIHVFPAGRDGEPYYLIAYTPEVEMLLKDTFHAITSIRRHRPRGPRARAA